MMEEAEVTIGEVCLLTNDVPRLAAFYKQLLGVENGSDDETHRVLLFSLGGRLFIRSNSW